MLADHHGVRRDFEGRLVKPDIVVPVSIADNGDRSVAQQQQAQYCSAISDSRGDDPAEAYRRQVEITFAEYILPNSGNVEYGKQWNQHPGDGAGSEPKPSGYGDRQQHRTGYAAGVGERRGRIEHMEDAERPRNHEFEKILSCQENHRKNLRLER